MMRIIVNSASRSSFAAVTCRFNNVPKVAAVSVLLGSSRPTGNHHQWQQLRSFDSESNQKAIDDYVGSLPPARKKMFEVLNAYRKENYTMTLPSRFLKDVLSAADANNDEIITVKEFRRLLENIGASDKLSEEELDEVFSELGVDDATDNHEKGIPVQTIVDNWRPLLTKVPVD